MSDFFHKPDWNLAKIERQPDGSVIFDPRGCQDTPDRPQLLECDCCCRHSDQLWCYPVKPFQVEYSPGRSLQVPDPAYWGFCMVCNLYFEMRDLPALAGRVSRLLGVPISDLLTIYEAVAAAVSAPWFSWKSGDLRPGKLLGG